LATITIFNLAVKKFAASKVADQQHIPSTETTTPTIRVILPFKDQDQASGNVVKKRIKDFSSKIKTVFISRKLNEALKFEKSSQPLLTNSA